MIVDSCDHEGIVGALLECVECRFDLQQLYDEVSGVFYLGVPCWRVCLFGAFAGAPVRVNAVEHLFFGQFCVLEILCRGCLWHRASLKLRSS